MGTEWFLALLPWLAILACPVAMFWMMRGTHGGSCAKEHASAGSAARNAAGDHAHPAAVASELAQLRERLALLESQRGALDAEAHR